MVVAFENVVDAERLRTVGCDGEARRVGTVTGWKVGAASAGVAHVAEW